MTNTARCLLLLGWLAIPAGAADTASVAEVLGRTIGVAELDAGQSGPVAAEQRLRWRAERLRELVWTAVVEDYAKQRNVSVSEAEVEIHIRAHARIQERLRRERDERHAALSAELRSPDLSEARRRQAQQELEVSERLRAFDAQREQDSRDPGRRSMQQDAERTVAVHWIRNWKINQALFREFGGRIVFQQAGWEPIDAYRRLLERYDARRAFTINDPALRPAVYSYFEHRFVYADEARAKYYFDKPWWERTPEELKAAGF